MKMSRVEEYLDSLFPNPKCELNYNTDYELLICIMLSAQTTDKRVNMVSFNLFNKYPSLLDLSRADLGDLEDIIRPLGSFRKKSLYVKQIATVLHNDYNDIVPVDRDILESLPGIGRKTVNVFLSEYYNYPLIAVDTHVERVSKRLGIALKNDNVNVIEKKLMKSFDKESWSKIHLQMVLFGRYYCKAIKPLCSECLIKDICHEKKKNFY